jgi:hypothetical protein
VLPLLLATLLQVPDPAVDAALVARKVVRRVDVKLVDLAGDFDGDGKADRAVAVKLSSGKDRGVLVVWGGVRPPVLLGAASDFNHFRDHDFDVWTLRKATGRAKRDAMVWEWSEKASARIVWTGKAFRWIQEGD